jgi:UDP-N-acetylmuramoyl-L-alanyl-D-glutamate--2,6-diaminopimelate ligase
MTIRRSGIQPVALATVAHNVDLEFSGDILVSGITHDSREVQAGDLYVAIPGFKNHGIEFMEQAAANGAVAVASDVHGVVIAQSLGLPTITLTNPRRDMALLAREVLGHPESKLTLIGVTGTNGKTTVASMIRHILTESGKSTGMIGTLGAFSKNEHLAGLRTTPESTDLYATLSYMVGQGVTHVVMEVSSHGLELDRVFGLSFDCAIFTNLSQDHLDFHGTMDAYFAAKKKLFEMAKVAVINTDDSYGARLASEISQATKQLTCGVQGDVSPSNVGAGRDGETLFDLTIEGEITNVKLPMIGDFNVMNALCAVAATTAVGISVEVAVNALSNFPGVPGRCERVVPSGQAIAIVDYAHTPDAVEKILEQLRKATAGKLICVLGCGGDRDPSKRFDMGKIASVLADVVVVTDDNPRTEDPAAIRAEVLRGAITGKADVHEIGDRQAAISYAISNGASGDIVAVLGKGHESGQEINGEVFPFDDREVIRQVSENA